MGCACCWLARSSAPPRAASSCFFVPTATSPRSCASRASTYSRRWSKARRRRSRRWPKAMPQSAKASFAFGPFRLLIVRHELLAQGIPVAIGQRALDVLLALVRRHGELVTKDELMSEVWPGMVVEENNLAVHISALRKILGQTGDGKSYLQPVAGRGYRFVASVTYEELSRTAEPAP